MTVHEVCWIIRTIAYYSTGIITLVYLLSLLSHLVRLGAGLLCRRVGRALPYYFGGNQCN